MRLQAVDYLCCPACNGGFELIVKEELEAEVIQGTLECRQCKRCFDITDGLPNLIFPEMLEESDRHAQTSYDRHPRIYELRMHWIGLRFGIWWIAFMPTRAVQMLVNKLELRKNASVLETGTGTGIALPGIAHQIGKEGQLHGSDISAGMLKVAQKKIRARRIRAELLQANASYLPYRTSAFDAVLHIGGWNTFADKERAVEEMHRVAKPGSKIVLCDEGLAPGKEKTWTGRRILKHDKRGLYSMKPPRELVPDNTEDVKVYWVWNGFYWVVEFRKK